MINRILSSGFLGLGDVFAQKAAPVLTSYQNSTTPAARPVSGSGESFSFASAFQKLLQPFQKVTDPKAAAASSIINSAGDTIAGIIGAFGNKAIDLIKTGNEKPAAVTTGSLNTGTVLPSQSLGFSLGDLMSVLNAGKPANSQITASGSNLETAAAQNSVNNVLLIGGLGLLMLLLVKGK